MDEFLGKTIGKYTIERVLGEGGMGSVYMARHKVLEHEVAIKILRSEFSDRPKLVQRFFLEAKTVAKLRDPGVAQLHDYGQTDDGLAYIVMEWLEGETLAARLRRHRSLDPIMALRVTRGVARTLAVVHERGVIHRDLKPENIFLVSSGSMGGAEQTKILDFGIAKLSPLNRGDIELTHESDVLGTPLYMAPEQWHGAHKVDGRADIYSLGCILFRMLAARPPFNGRTLAELCKGHLADAPPRLKDIEPSVTDDVNELVMSCLDKNREGRPASMRIFAKQLARVLKAQVELTLKVEPSALSSILAALDLDAGIDAGIPARSRNQTEKMELPAVSAAMLNELARKAEAQQAAKAAPAKATASAPTSSKPGPASAKTAPNKTAPASPRSGPASSKTGPASSKTAPAKAGPPSSKAGPGKTTKLKRRRQPSIGTAAFGFAKPASALTGAGRRRAATTPLAPSAKSAASGSSATPSAASAGLASTEGATAASEPVSTSRPTTSAAPISAEPVSAARPAIESAPPSGGPISATAPLVPAPQPAIAKGAAAPVESNARATKSDPATAPEESSPSPSKTSKAAAAALNVALVQQPAHIDEDSSDLQGWELDEKVAAEESSDGGPRETTRLPATDVALSDLDETLKEKPLIPELNSTQELPPEDEQSDSIEPPLPFAPAQTQERASIPEEDPQHAPPEPSPFGQTERLSVEDLAEALVEPELVDGFDPTTTTASGTAELPALRPPRRSSMAGYSIAAVAALVLGGILALIWPSGDSGSATILSTVMSKPAQAMSTLEAKGAAASAADKTAAAAEGAADKTDADATGDKDENAGSDDKPSPATPSNLKRSLYRKALGNKATESELRLLEKICRNEGDRNCSGFARRLLKQKALNRVPPHRRNEPIDIY